MSDLTFAVGSVFVAVTALGYYVGQGILKSQASSNRLAALRQTRRDMLDSGFAERAIAPLVRWVGRLALRYTPAGFATRTKRRLIYAGLDHSLDVNAWAAIRVLSGAASVVVWALLLQANILSSSQEVLLLPLLLFLGLFGPEGYLNNRISDRRKAMQNELPDILDLLVISVEAGLGFDAALGRVVEKVPGELSHEFNRMLQETRVGVSRADAMKHLNERTDVDDLQSFLLSMGQAEAFGVSIARVLRVQADEMRIKRRQRAQERAFAAPVKMVFPLVFCIFPALFVILLGPAAIEIFKSF